MYDPDKYRVAAVCFYIENKLLIKSMMTIMQLEKYMRLMQMRRMVHSTPPVLITYKFDTISKVHDGLYNVYMHEISRVER